MKSQMGEIKMCGFNLTAAQRAAILTLAVLVLGAFGFSESARAATLTVTAIGDTTVGAAGCGDGCSLREAVTAAVSGDMIAFSSLFNTAQTIALPNGQITIGKNLTINGTGADLLTIQNTKAASTTSRVFNVSSGFTLSLNNLKITGGNNPTGLGGGINADGDLNITNCTISGNSGGTGGGIATAGNLNITNSTISGNTAAGVSGGIDHAFGTATIINSTISGNTVTGNGGGMTNLIGTVNLINSTITNNSATGNGGGIFTDGGNYNIRNTIIAANIGNATKPDTVNSSGGTMTSNGNNFIGNRGTVVFGGAGDQAGTTGSVLNPRLAPLGNYGGKTFTHALLSGSTAINGGNNCVTTASCAPNNPPAALTADQRGATRIGNVDIGSFELNTSTNGGSFVAVLPSGTVSQSYSQTIISETGTTTYCVSSGSLPPGLSGINGCLLFAESNAENIAASPAAALVISGTPTMTNTYNFSVTANNGGNTNVTNYQLQVAPPTAASVSVGGRVLASNNITGVSGAIVLLTDASGNTRTVRTSSFGYFRFDEIEVGQTVIVTVSSKRYQFASQVLTVTEEFSELNFTAQQ